MSVRAVFFDVDFTLIYPGPTFQAAGYEHFCRRHGIDVDPGRFAHAVAAASDVLNEAQDHIYDAEVFIRYTRRLIEGMGGTGPRLNDCAREVYDEWAVLQHFHLYDDVAAVLQTLAGRGLQLGLISNSHRCLASFQRHFELEGLIAGAVSGHQHGYMKPHSSIFEAALTLVGASAEQSVMVGDSLPHDIEGARRIGMRGVLVDRSDADSHPAGDVPVVRSLDELPALIETW